MGGFTIPPLAFSQTIFASWLQLLQSFSSQPGFPYGTPLLTIFTNGLTPIGVDGGTVFFGVSGIANLGNGDWGIASEQINSQWFPWCKKRTSLFSAIIFPKNSGVFMFVTGLNIGSQ